MNNNTVVTKDKNGREKIVMGCGIAFQKKVGDSFDDAKVDKVFSLSSLDASTKFQELIADIPMEHVQLADQIITYAKTKLGKKLNDMIYISLTDHIYTAIIRFSEGITVKNAFLWEICRFYPDEFEIGRQVLVIFGLHWAIQGSFAVGFAQTGVVAAMYFRLNDQKVKKMCPTAVVSGLFGVTESSTYGISLPKKYHSSSQWLQVGSAVPLWDLDVKDILPAAWEFCFGVTRLWRPRWMKKQRESLREKNC